MSERISSGTKIEAAAAIRHAQVAVVNHYALRVHARYMLTLEALIKHYEAAMWLKFSELYNRTQYVFGKVGLTHEREIVYELERIGDTYIQTAAALGYERGLRDLTNQGWIKYYRQPVKPPIQAVQPSLDFNNHYLEQSFGPSIIALKPTGIHARLAQYSHYLWRAAEFAYRTCIRDFTAFRKPQRESMAEGGPGSGYHDHPGRPGEVGGSTGSGADKLAAANAKTQAVFDANPHDHELVQRTADTIAANKPFFDGLVAKLQEVFPTSKVEGRQKSLGSAVNKLETNPKWQNNPSLLPDINAVRITNSLDTFNEIEEKLRANFPVVEEKNYIETERDDAYRAVHFIVDDGTYHAEIQVRTPYQTQWADWQWNFYKDLQYGKMPSWWTDHLDTIRSYSKAMSDYYFARDRGLEAPKPDCPDVVRITITCL